jgi:hypothetical protein
VNAEQHAERTRAELERARQQLRAELMPQAAASSSTVDAGAEGALLSRPGGTAESPTGGAGPAAGPGATAVPPSSERKRRAYRLVVDIPPECLEPGYVPEALAGDWFRDFDRQPFTWPPRRHYFSVESASRRAYKLAQWGATVRVEELELVDWQPTAIVYTHAEVTA